MPPLVDFTFASIFWGLQFHNVPPIVKEGGQSDTQNFPDWIRLSSISSLDLDIFIFDKM